MMTKKKFWANISLATWWFIPVFILGAGPQACCTDVKFHGKAVIGVTTLEVGNQCVILTAYFLDNLLEGLVWHAPPASAEFTKNGHVIKDFANQTNFVIYGYLLPCKGRRSTASSLPIDHLMKSLKFRMSWLKDDPPALRTVPVSATPRIALGEEHWKYRFVVQSKAIPLSTPAEIEISTEYSDRPVLIRGSLYTHLQQEKPGCH
jgi:hypothetical protein